jgi:hypothetical protein
MLYDFLEVLNHAYYEPDIIFLIRPSDGPVWFTGVSHCGYMRYHETKVMILVDLNESYQIILKSSHIAWKKVPLLWGQKSYFFSFAPKRLLSQFKIGTIQKRTYNSPRAIRITII